MVQTANLRSVLSPGKRILNIFGKYDSFFWIFGIFPQSENKALRAKIKAPQKLVEGPRKNISPSKGPPILA